MCLRCALRRSDSLSWSRESAVKSCGLSETGELRFALPDSGSSARKGVEVRVLFSAFLSIGVFRPVQAILLPVWPSA
jgi:hypothetical protein